MKLAELLRDLPGLASVPPENPDVERVVSDSRLVQPGDLFVALSGLSTDGHRFLGQAARRGAAAAVVEQLVEGEDGQPGLPLARVGSTRQALGWLSAALYGRPSDKLTVIGVTGTDGKTTTSSLIHHILQGAGRSAGLISTVEAHIGHEVLDTGPHVSTPLAEDLQRYLALMVEKGAALAVVETTSHGLDQGRLEGTGVDVAVLTNVTHEHLDYHGGWEAYRQAKAILFQMLSSTRRRPGQPKVSVLNAQDPSYAYFARIAADEVWSYGLEVEAPRPALVGRDLRLDPSGLSFQVETAAGTWAMNSPLVGDYNAQNILAAVAACLALGIDGQAIRQGVASFKGVTGRMERLELGQPFNVVIDFAHTPVSLERALRTLRQVTPGELRVVYGCAGQRDRLKRPLMGRTAIELADEAILTAEDPRTEDLATIIEEIAAGCREAGGVEGRSFFRQPDREEAIRFAFGRSKGGDTVILAGKGHEPTMCFGTTEIPWSEHQAARRAWAALTRRESPPAAG